MTTKGLTLIEIILVMAISSIIIMALMRFMAAGYPLSRVVFLQASSTETARVQLKRLSKALRELRESDTGAYGLVAAEPQRIVFYSDIDSDDTTERVRYELVGTDLTRGIIKPSGEPLAYREEEEEVAVVAGRVQNGGAAVFTYYTGDYPADPMPLSPADLMAVKYIQFRLMIDADPDVDPLPIEVLSQVQLRNLKVNLGQEVE